jgi:O-methyltransferase domain
MGSTTCKSPILSGQKELLTGGEGAMATTTSRMGSFYNEKLATSELRKYREKGPSASTQALIDAMKAEGVEGATLLDIGGGIGAIQHELLAAGAAHATSVEASASYLEVAQEESLRRDLGDRVTYRHGDFVELADSIPPADIVTLDRVINVYPDWERLTELAAARAQRLFGLVYPRDTPTVRSRLDPFRRRDRADHSGKRSQPSLLSECRTRVAGRGLPPRCGMTEPPNYIPGSARRYSRAPASRRPPSATVAVRAPAAVGSVWPT